MNYERIEALYSLSIGTYYAAESYYPQRCF